MTFIKRADLGRPLTWDELDSNFEQVDSYAAAASASASAAQTQAGNASQSASQALQSQQAAEAAAASAEGAVDDFKNTLIGRGGAGEIGDVIKPVTWSGFSGGADPTGVTDSDNAFAASDKSAMYIPGGVYKLSTNWTIPDDNAYIVTDSSVYFTGAKPNFTGIIPYQGGPIWSGQLYRKTYLPTEWSSFGNIFQTAHYAKTQIADAPRGGANVVALYSGADAAGDGSSAWATNFVAYANNANSTAIGIELNYGCLVDGGLGYGLIIASAGSYTAQAGLQLQANNANSKMQQGLRFNNRSFGLAVDYLVGCSGDITSSPANIGIDFSRHSFPTAEISTKSLLVDATRTNSVSRLKITGAASGGSPTLGVDSTDANVNVAVTAKGTGQILFNTNGAEGFRISASGQPDSLSVNQGTGSALLSARGTSTDVSIHLAPKGAGNVRLQSNLSLSASNTYTCGISATPWAGGFTQTAFTITSGAKFKGEPLDITDAMIDAVEECPPIQYQLLSAIAKKGPDGARWHFGTIAERLEDAFERHGLDVRRYAFFCEDYVEHKPAVIDEETGVELEPEQQEGLRLGVRYEELLMLEAALQRRNYKRLMNEHSKLISRIEALENKS